MNRDQYWKEWFAERDAFDANMEADVQAILTAPEPDLSVRPYVKRANRDRDAD